MINRPRVSIICCTYNHGLFIRDTLDSLLAQKTNFPIEILVHDDASTDNTAAIIKEYEKAYPEIIRPVYEGKNQSSKGIDVQQINFERSRGKYIAICNGDDLWIDEYKLQRQYDYLEQTKNCVLSVHSCLLVDKNIKQINEVYAPSKMNRFYHTHELIGTESGLFVPSSMFFQANIVKNRPALFINTPVSDYILILYLSLFGQVHFMRDVMSSKRVDLQDSLGVEQIAGNKSIDEDFQKIGEWFLRFDEWTNYSFSESIEAKLKANNFKYTRKQKEYKELESMSLRQVYSSMPLKSIVGLILQQYLPQLAGILKRRQWLMYKLLYRRHY